MSRPRGRSSSMWQKRARRVHQHYVSRDIVSSDITRKLFTDATLQVGNHTYEFLSSTTEPLVDIICALLSQSIIIDCAGAWWMMDAAMLDLSMYVLTTFQYPSLRASRQPPGRHLQLIIFSSITKLTRNILLDDFFALRPRLNGNNSLMPLELWEVQTLSAPPPSM
jgi:hypothetical protein